MQHKRGVSNTPPLDDLMEEPLSWNGRIRQFHRWTGIVFTATVIANFATMTQGTPPSWVTYSPLPPLFLLIFSGLFMFGQHYVSGRRTAVREG